MFMIKNPMKREYTSLQIKPYFHVWSTVPISGGGAPRSHGLDLLDQVQKTGSQLSRLWTSSDLQALSHRRESYFPNVSLLEALAFLSRCIVINLILLCSGLCFINEKFSLAQQPFGTPSLPRLPLGNNMNGSWNEKFFRVEMASRTYTALDQLNHIIDATFSGVEKVEPFHRYTTLQSLYTALDHQLQDGVMSQHEFDRTKVVGLEATNPYDWEGKCAIVWCHWTYYHVDAALVLRGYNYNIVVHLPVYLFVNKMMSRLIAKGIIRRYSMRQRRGRPVQQPIGIVSNCDVCGRLMFNAQRYMHMNDASTIRFPYELMKIIDRILHELRYHREHPHTLCAGFGPTG